MSQSARVTLKGRVALPETKTSVGTGKEGALRHQVRLSMDRKWAHNHTARPNNNARRVLLICSRRVNY